MKYSYQHYTQTYIECQLLLFSYHPGGGDVGAVHFRGITLWYIASCRTSANVCFPDNDKWT